MAKQTQSRKSSSSKVGKQTPATIKKRKRTTSKAKVNDPAQILLNKRRMPAQDFVFGEGSLNMIPMLTQDQTANFQYSVWDENSKLGFVECVVLMSVSVQGGLFYSQSRFQADCHSIFKLISPELFQSILSNLFSDLKKFIDDNMCGSKLNFFTVSRFIKIYTKRPCSTRETQFCAINRKPNIGFQLTENTRNYMIGELQRLDQLFINHVDNAETQPTLEKQLFLQQVYANIQELSGKSSLELDQLWMQCGFVSSGDTHKNGQQFAVAQQHLKLLMLWSKANKRLEINDVEDLYPTDKPEKDNIPEPENKHTGKDNDDEKVDEFIPAEQPTAARTLFSSNESADSQVEQQKWKELEDRVTGKKCQALVGQKEVQASINAILVRLHKPK